MLQNEITIEFECKWRINAEWVPNVDTEIFVTTWLIASLGTV